MSRCLRALSVVLFPELVSPTNPICTFPEVRTVAILSSCLELSLSLRPSAITLTAMIAPFAPATFFSASDINFSESKIAKVVYSVTEVNSLESAVRVASYL